MKEKLTQKLAETGPYSREDLTWCLDHIGAPDPAIRDDLVYQSLRRAIIEGRLSPTDYCWLAEETKERQLLTHGLPQQGLASLTRSFTALLVSLLLQADAGSDHPFQGLLSHDQRSYFLEKGLDFLSFETDWRGYDPSHSWVHALAHGADLLLAVALHPAFPADQLTSIWSRIINLLKSSPQTFAAGEKQRLALVLAQLIQSAKLPLNRLTDWLSELDFSDDNPSDYLAWLNAYHFLTSLYFQLAKAGIEYQELHDKLVHF